MTWLYFVLVQSVFVFVGQTLAAVQLATPRVSGATPRPALGAGALLRWACALEARASHPVAAAVLAGSGAAVRIAAKQCKVTEFETLAVGRCTLTPPDP
jgi:cation transport ATPase